MITYGKQSLDQSDIDAVIKVLKSDWLTQGPAVETFEKDLNAYYNSDFACAVCNGTAALHLAGLALDWDDKDIILTTPISFLATSNSIIYSGATPDFVDIDPITYNIDPTMLEEKILFHKTNNKNVKAVIGVDFAGQPCDWISLRSIADKYSIKLINDNCHAIGAEYRNDRNYACKFADIVTTSHHPVKHITTGEGGAVITNNKDIYDRVKKLRTHGIKSSNKLPWYYEMQELGYNYRLTDFQSALGSSQLKKIGSFLNKRRELAKVYDDRFRYTDVLTIPSTVKSSKHAYHLYPLLIDFEKIGKTKLQLFEFMLGKGIKLQVHYIPIHLQPYYSKYGFKKGDFPIAEKFYEQEISLPIHQKLTHDDQEKVIRELLYFINEF